MQVLFEVADCEVIQFILFALKKFASKANCNMSFYTEEKLNNIFIKSKASNS